MMFGHSHRKVPALNTTSTADISFMLLILFLVTTSMDTDKGLSRQLPPPVQEKSTLQMDMKTRNVMTLHISRGNVLLCNDKPINIKNVRQRVKEFVDNAANSALLPEKHIKNIPLLGRCTITDQHVVSILADRDASYNTYFNVQNEIVGAYNELRNGLAQKKFGRPFNQCTSQQQDAIRKYYPQRISETEPDEKGGGQQ
jgi:biopolymer transport protein ExbD